ncbi:MAG: DMT family transporter [Chloroflexi bacterium]|nr:DMT family transporter [Chloroflexota bacterium]
MSALYDAIAARPRLAALLGAFCISFSGIFYRYADVSPSTVTVFRSLYGLPILILVAMLERRRYGPMSRRTVYLAIIAGVFFAGDLLTWHNAVNAVGAGLATVLGNMQVLVVGFVAWVVLGERPPRPVIAATPVVLVGAILISGVIGTGAYGANPPLGVGLGTATALFYAGYLLIIRRGTNDTRRPAGPVAIATASTMVVAIIVGLIIGDLNLVPSWPSHGWLALVGITSQSVGYLLISMSLPRLPAAVVSIILLAQPVGTVILARVLLTEIPSTFQFGGVLLIVGGIALATIPVGRLRDRARGVTT